MQATKKNQQGMMLLEALLGILIFSLAVLALVAMASTAVTVQADAQFRSDAMKLAQHISSEIWTGVDRTTEVVGGVKMSVVTAASLQQFQHKATGGSCAFTGAASARSEVTDWVASVQNILPGSSDAMQQIIVNPAINNQVFITICWRAPADNQTRHYTLATYVN